MTNPASQAAPQAARRRQQGYQAQRGLLRSIYAATDPTADPVERLEQVQTIRSEHMAAVRRAGVERQRARRELIKRLAAAGRLGIKQEG